MRSFWLHTAAAVALGLLVGLTASSRQAAPPPVLLDAYDVRSYGAKCDGKADDTAAVQAALDAAPDGARVTIPWWGNCRITSTLYLFSRSDLEIVGGGKPGARPAGRRGAELTWAGPAGCDALLALNSCHTCSLENLSFSCDTSATPPGCAVRSDTWTDPAGQKPTVTSSSLRVERCAFTPPPVNGANFSCLEFSRTATASNEGNFVVGCVAMPTKSATNWGKFCVFGGSTNCDSNLVANCNFSSATVGVHSYAGGVSVEYCRGNGNATDVQYDGFSRPVVVRGCNFEHDGCFVRTLAGTGALVLQHNRIGSCQGPVVLSLKNQQTVSVGNTWVKDGPNAACNLVQTYTGSGGDYRVHLLGDMTSKVGMDFSGWSCVQRDGVTWQRGY